MININSVTLVGRITKDIDLRKTSSNTSVCNFTVAVDRRFQSQQTNGQTADFINCIAWRQSADFLASYAGKGTIVAVEGRIQTRSYDGQNGKVYVTEVVADNVQIISSAQRTGTNVNSSFGNSNYSSASNQTFTPSVDPDFESMDDDFSNTPSLDISSDDLPFY
ncbi:MAG: single-stranded DNA-binding protein [Erysipelotrichaceae bacterium]|jgi:single-strand DNA-binding protein|nr:single-stranded DNA-binding protein [Erysipelotrichaceae bacterium]